MKQYELMTIADIALGEDGARDVSNKIKDLIVAKKGKVLDSEFWGKRKFAYEIENKDEGYYEVVKFEIYSGFISELKTKLNLVSGLVRYLVTTAK